ncbi:CbiX/SirB N-terminal domain-containing protein [Thiomonas sp. 13-64-67]|uniref:sirohydrochlorin chelatase n=1 Tax=Thiomonas sp. 13-64-67 TaxID=1970447 RepID=UPI000BD00CB2|nr:CbiX/SirB N-terminal domain-containing protein [Thiomonas sp. 13-64-67]OZB69051.1 MAG: hypothetical protein B7X30_14415 [Thiomonas sp. 13-64-67]
MNSEPRLLVLLAHGSRLAEWALPFEAVCGMVQSRHPELTVRLAFLESMQPSLQQALEEAGQNGTKHVHIAPLFLGAGGHLRRDIPEVVQAARARYPKLRIVLAQPAGEDAGVIAALAAYATQSQENELFGAWNLHELRYAQPTKHSDGCCHLPRYRIGDGERSGES